MALLAQLRRMMHGSLEKPLDFAFRRNQRIADRRVRGFLTVAYGPDCGHV